MKRLNMSGHRLRFDHFGLSRIYPETKVINVQPIMPRHVQTLHMDVFYRGGAKFLMCHAKPGLYWIVMVR